MTERSTQPHKALPPIPDTGLLLHIGVFKTGTTALQETLWFARDFLAEQGVLFHGPRSWHHAAPRVLANSHAPLWIDLVREINDHPGRCMLSSEDLCGCSNREARKMVAALGAGRPVHVLITVRALAELLPSTWQQFLKKGMSQPYEAWLEQVVADSATGRGIFWRRNDFPEQVRRWGRLVGSENLTVVVSDKRQPARLLRVTEQLLALPPDSLRFPPTGKSNESLSYPEAELLRRVNEAVVAEFTESDYKRLVRLGVFPAMDRARLGRPAIPVPEWVAHEMVRIGRAQAHALRAQGVRVVGDIDALAERPDAVSESASAPGSISVDSATAAVVGAVTAKRRQRAAKRARRKAGPRRLRGRDSAAGRQTSESAAGVGWRPKPDD